VLVYLSKRYKCKREESLTAPKCAVPGLDLDFFVEVVDANVAAVLLLTLRARW
jgi:hypothetical protein